MSTHVYDLVEGLPARWREVDVLLETARAREADPGREVHDVLCRASVVLIVAHLEGFVRDCARAIIDDLNRFSTFKQSPKDLKRTFCQSFVPKIKDGPDNDRVMRLIELLDGLDTKYTHEPFLTDRGEYSRNPSPAVVEKVARNFGIEKVFVLVASSRADDVFTNIPSETEAVAVDLRAHLMSNARRFPYSIDLLSFGLDKPGSTRPGGRTLWEAFLDDLLTKRHSIAHGSDRLNGLSVGEITSIKSKVVVLQYALTLVLCGQVR
jgi:hypothetical protein